MDLSSPWPEDADPRSSASEQLSKPPSLLPAFEPFSSSPPHRPSLKRKLDGSPNQSKATSRFYPTPIPTSSTGILPSSPDRPALQRTVSTLSERAPLSTVPDVKLPADGQPVLLGRSSNSSNFQLSSNRVISRVHVRVRYRSPTPSKSSGEVTIECLGWNGVKVHCGGRAVDLKKGEEFCSDDPSQDILLDVHDSRVFLSWPTSDRSRPASTSSDESASDTPSPSQRHRPQTIPSSPPAVDDLLKSRSRSSQRSSHHETFRISDLSSQLSEHQNAIKVYEDPDSEQLDGRAAESNLATPTRSREQRRSSQPKLAKSLDDLSDHNEENDPVVHSFGPFGENILPRFASFNTSHSPRQPSQTRTKTPLKPPSQPVHGSPSRFHVSPIKNHVVNQLAFSRLHSVPLSTIFGNLPDELKRIRSSRAKDGASTSLLALLNGIPSVGEIPREGKDAAGKPLETEFYYVPELDDNDTRRDAVLGSRGGTGLRSVRRTHKQYYWKKPRH
ncbi:hypothetical protein P152DRAFT_406014 [Eremomyces bilateralis CBS 781.70]|uniref:FHA domain-containing protein n=1 Tax=Eremomyces bilateralis CBS 781.70 TaxID=1392243 RepID=A0A6G1FQZ9_9PEZI|nr:uncharacterized protein P152DRAFT_406014 [Eremomyces bilateralis CBS 781.70]KAF1808176.1 hypothetical protein P152DRAFT_406014 [Eremomyces bilateralis CBS 781.70]